MTDVPRAYAFIRLMRPHQWSKNAVVLAGLVFSGQAGEVHQVFRSVVALCAFCLASSAIYAFNDWHDRFEDRLHPVKNRRPVASGAIAPPVALAFGTALLTLGFLIALSISVELASIILAYAILLLAYTLWVRRIAILDVLTIAAGFVLRAMAGAIAVSVPLSSWLFACTLLLALMLGLGKRRNELKILGGQTEHRRPSLAGYARFDLDRLMIAIAILTSGAYVLYTLAVPTFGRNLPMLLTVPFVIVAIARYMYLVIRHNLGGAPELLLVRDRPLFLSIITWSLMMTIVLLS